MRIAPAIAAVAALALSSTAVAADWRVAESRPALSPWSSIWAASLATPPVAIAADGTALIVGVSDTAPHVMVSAVDPATGSTRWSWQPGYSRAAYINRLAVCATGGFAVAGLRLASDDPTSGQRVHSAWVARVDGNGATRWQVDLTATQGDTTGNAVTALATLPDCTVLVSPFLGFPVAQGRLVALRADDGSLAWDVGFDVLGGSPNIVFPVAGSGVAVATRGGATEVRVSVLEQGTGVLRWARTLPNLVPNSSVRFVIGGTAHGTDHLAIAFTHPEAVGHVLELQVLEATSGQPVGSGTAPSTFAARRLTSQGAAGLRIETEREVHRFDRAGTFVASRSYSDARAVTVVGSGDVLVGSEAMGGHLRLHDAADDQIRWSTLIGGSPPDGFVVAAGAQRAIGYFAGTRALFARSVVLQDGALGPALEASIEESSAATESVVHGNDVLVSRVYLQDGVTILEASRLDKSTGSAAWTTRLSVGTTVRHANAYLTRPLALADGSVLVTAASTAAGGSLATFEGAGFAARIRLADGVVIEREVQADGWLVADITTSGSDAYATRFRPGQGAAAGTVEYAVERIEGLDVIWRHVLPTGVTAVDTVALASSAGVVVYSDDDALELLRRSDGGVAWQVPWTVALPTRLLAHPDGDFYVLTRRDGPGSFLDIAVDRLDGASGATRWTRFLEGVSGGFDTHAFYSVVITDGLLLTWSAAASPNAPTFRTAFARLGDDGVVRWQRVHDAGPAAWSTYARMPSARPDGALRVPVMSTPSILTSATPEVGLHSILELAPTDGSIVRMRPMRTSFDAGAANGERLASGIEDDASQSVASLTVLQSGRPTLRGNASVRVEGPAATSPRVSAHATLVPGVRRRLRIDVSAAADAVPPGTAATVSVVLPSGLVADSVQCSGSNAVCLAAHRLGTLQQPVIWSGNAMTDLLVEAEALDGATVFGELRVVLDIEAPVVGADPAARVLIVPWSLAPPADPLFGDGFEPLAADP